MSKNKYSVIQINGKFEPCIEIDGVCYLLNEQKTKFKEGENISLKIKLKKAYIDKNMQDLMSEDIQDLNEVREEYEEIKERIFLKFITERGIPALHDEELESRDAELDIVYSKTEEGFNLHGYEIEWKDNLLQDLFKNYRNFISFHLNGVEYQLEDAELPDSNVKVIKNKYDTDLDKQTLDYKFIKITNNEVLVAETEEKVSVLLNGMELNHFLNNTINIAEIIGQFLIARESDRN